MAAAASIFVGIFRFLRGLRFRIAFSYVIFFALVLSVLGLVFRQALDNIFEAQMKDILNDDWGAVKGYLRLGTKVGPDWFFDPYDPEEQFIVGRLRRVFLLADAEGHPLQPSAIYTSIGYDSPDYIKSVLKSNTKQYRVRYSKDGVPYMILGGPIIDERHNKYFMAVGRSIADNEKAVNDFTWNYFTILPLVIAISSLFGWFLAGRALDPVNKVADTAERITHSNLNLRIPLRGAKDELDRLIDAFNHMMERLHFSFEQIRQFSTDVSHELRTPLTVIRGQLEVALFTSQTVDQYREAMVNALEDVERLSNIVRALLMLSQAESGKLALNKTNMDLAETICDLVDEYQIPAEAAGVRLAQTTPPNCLVHADPVQMERLITNLLSNAIKYTPAGGRVNVRLASADGSVKLTVEDTGVGISPDHLPHIFDRFYRVPSADPEKGLGLGLSFVAWIVKAHGGTVDVASELQKGTRFTITLPAAQPAPRAPETIGTSEQANPVN